jgi:hypothetical protein
MQACRGLIIFYRCLGGDSGCLIRVIQRATWRDAQLATRARRGIEIEIEQIKQRSRQNESEAEQRMKQLENEILRVRSETEQIEKETEQL